MPALVIDALSKNFGSRRVLQRVNLHLQSQTRLAVLGRSGVGKSTLLRILAGVESADGGRIELDGTDITRLPAHRRQLALMSQDYALYPHQNVRKNLLTALLPLRLGRAEQAARSGALLQQLRIADLQDQLPAQLSGGQAQRVALAKALIRRPQWLLLDEPFSQLDGPLREELGGLVLESVVQLAAGLVLVTHDPLDALRLATHIAILDQSRIVQYGAADEVYQRPATRAAAELLSPWGINWLDASQLTGFRPEAARLESATQVAPEGAAELRLPGVVARLTYLGFAQLIDVQAGGRPHRCLLPLMPLGWPLTSDSPAGTAAAPLALPAPWHIGQPCQLVIPSAALIKVAG